MSIISRMGRSLMGQADDATRIGGSILDSRGLVRGAIGLGAVSGLVKGFSSTSGDVTSSLYGIATGNPNIDQDIFGTDLGMRELFFPMPQLPRPHLFPALSQGIRQYRDASRLERRLFRNPQMWGLAGQAQNTDYFNMQNQRGFQSVPQMTRPNPRYYNSMPTVSGDVVFGSWNSRKGGGF